MSRFSRRVAGVAVWSLMLGMLVGVSGSSTALAEEPSAESVSRSISGRVTLAEGVDPQLLERVRVHAFLDGAHEPAADAVSVALPVQSVPLGEFGNADPNSEFGPELPDEPVMPGAYRVEGLAPGKYRVEFSVEGVSAEVLAGAVFRDGDGAVALVDATAGSVVGIDVQLAPQTVISADTLAPTGRDKDLRATSVADLRTISGTVTVPAGFSTGDINVTVWDTSWSQGYSTLADPVTGQYAVSWLTPGRYFVEFAPGWDSNVNLLSQYWQSADSSPDATIVDVTQADASAVDAIMQEGRSISGTVEVPTGFNLADVRVSASSASGSMSYGSATVDPATGEYRIVGLAPGAYRVQFSPIWGSDVNLRSQYWDGTDSYSEANVVDVSDGDATGIDAILQEGRSISGTVEVPTGFNLADVRVSASSASGSMSYGSATVDPATGEYRIVGLAPGAYRVQFSTVWGADVNLVSQYWDGALTYSDADLVNVAEGDATGIHAVMQEGRIISGTVTTPAGFSAGDVRVSVSSEGMSASSTPDPATGEYRIIGLTPGSYRVSFEPTFESGANLVLQYWNNRSTYGDANPVVISASDATGIDAVLVEGAQISGTILGLSVPANTWASVSAVDSEGSSRSSATVSSSGTFVLRGLAAGTYRLVLSQYGESVATAQFLTIGDAHSWSLDAGDELELEFQVARGTGSITGLITTTGVDPVGQSAAAFLYQRLGADWVLLDSTFFLSNGVYEFPSLLAGEYRIGFGLMPCEGTAQAGGCSGEFPESQQSWWNGKDTLASANTITLTDGQTRTGINGTVNFPREPVPDWMPVSSRLSGADRFDTAVAISQSEFTDPSVVDTVVLATGYGFADALSAASLATKLGGPLLLTQPDVLTAATEGEIARLDPSRVIIVGGEPAVGAPVGNQLSTLGYEVERLSGPDRFATSIAIAERGWSDSGAESVFLATGLNFPDALSASAAAAGAGMPVVLVNGGASSLTDEQLALLSELGADTAHIAGSPVVVSAGIEAQLDALSSGSFAVSRYAGTDRINTSALIAQEFGTVGKPVYIAQGWNFPDALAGAAVAGARDGVLVLSQKECLSAGLRPVFQELRPASVTLLGGVPALSERVSRYEYCG